MKEFHQRACNAQKWHKTQRTADVRDIMATTGTSATFNNELRNAVASLAGLIKRHVSHVANVTHDARKSPQVCDGDGTVEFNVW
jgi:hypothetical protein